MNQKVVFLDVDGTIVNDKGTIPESTQIAIRKAVENGHKLVVCSGRSLFNCRRCYWILDSVEWLRQPEHR